MTKNEEGTLHTLKVMAIVIAVVTFSYFMTFTFFKPNIIYSVSVITSYFGG